MTNNDDTDPGLAPGVISDRLRRQFDKDDEAWAPPREADGIVEGDAHPERMTKPGEEDGWAITGRN